MDQLSRRAFVVGAGSLGLLAGCGRWPGPGQESPPTRVKAYRLGFLHGGTPAGTAPLLAIFQQALVELGYVEGQNLVVQYRWGEGSDRRLVEPAAELPWATMRSTGSFTSSTAS
jgi:hypothetical protein